MSQHKHPPESQGSNPTLVPLRYPAPPAPSRAETLAKQIDNFFELSSSLLCIITIKGYFQRVNPAWERTLGYTIDELYRKPIMDLVHPDDHAATLNARDRLQDQGGEIFHFELRMLCKDGSVRWLVWNVAPPSSTLFYCVAHDVTERKETEKALRQREQEYRHLFNAMQRQAQELSLLGHTRTALARQMDLTSMIMTVVEAIAENFGYTHVSSYLLQGDKLLLAHQVGYDNVLQEIPVSRGICGRVVRTAKPVLLKQAQSDPDFLAAVGGIESEVCVPLFDNRRVVGTLNIESMSGTNLGEHDLRLMVAMSEHVGIALERARLYSEVSESESSLRRQNELLAALHETALGMMNRLNVSELLQAIVARAAQLAGTPHGYVYLCAPNDQEMELQVGIGLFEGFIGYRIRAGEGLGGKVLQSARPLVVENYGQWEGRSPDARWDTLYATMSVPLLSDNQVIGVIGLARAEPGRPFRADEVDHLNRFAQLAALALDNARLYTAAQEELVERKRAEEALRESEKRLFHDAFHDALTNLPNRALFMERLERCIHRAQRHPGYLFAVLFLDLDRFKLVNDSLGHLAGDELLVLIARRMEQCLRPFDTIARLGGDEFTILLEEMVHPNDAVLVAERVQEALAQPFLLHGQDVFISASIGIVPGDTSYQRPEEFLRNADIAMYRAKALGKARHEVFDHTMHTRAVEMLKLETALRHALDRNEFSLHYQPIVSLHSGQITGFEALLRWNPPNHRTVSPAEFIPLAEETGLIVPIGWWVLREACAQMHEWLAAFPERPPLTINVNLSAKQLTCPDLVEQIQQILHDTQLPPRSLKLEITESVIMNNAEVMGSTLAKLRAMGVYLQLDDFGTGYSSLGYLHRFPIDTLKIDRSFVHQLKANGEREPIIQAIVTLAHSLAMDVIAEGVETIEQLEYLRGLCCEFGQGYFFSRALDSQAAKTLLATGLQSEAFSAPLPR